MRIEIPHFATEIEDEGVIVFLAFMMRMTKRCNDTKFGNGYKGTRYYMHASDIRHLLRRYLVSPEKIHDDIYAWCRVGKASDKMWMFEWKSRIRTEHYELKDPHFCGIWGYVIGRDVSSELLGDVETRGIPEAQPKVISRRIDEVCFSFSKEK